MTSEWHRSDWFSIHRDSKHRNTNPIEQQHAALQAPDLDEAMVCSDTDAGATSNRFRMSTFGAGVSSSAAQSLSTGVSSAPVLSSYRQSRPEQSRPEQSEDSPKGAAKRAGGLSPFPSPTAAGRGSLCNVCAHSFQLLWMWAPVGRVLGNLATTVFGRSSSSSGGLSELRKKTPASPNRDQAVSPTQSDALMRIEKPVVGGSDEAVVGEQGADSEGENHVMMWMLGFLQGFSCPSNLLSVVFMAERLTLLSLLLYMVAYTVSSCILMGLFCYVLKYICELQMELATQKLPMWTSSSSKAVGVLSSARSPPPGDLRAAMRIGGDGGGRDVVSPTRDTELVSRCSPPGLSAEEGSFLDEQDHMLRERTGGSEQCAPATTTSPLGPSPLGPATVVSPPHVSSPASDRKVDGGPHLQPPSSESSVIFPSAKMSTSLSVTARRRMHIASSLLLILMGGAVLLEALFGVELVPDLHQHGHAEPHDLHAGHADDGNHAEAVQELVGGHDDHHPTESTLGGRNTSPDRGNKAHKDSVQGIAGRLKKMVSSSSSWSFWGGSRSSSAGAFRSSKKLMKMDDVVGGPPGGKKGAHGDPAGGKKGEHQVQQGSRGASTSSSWGGGAGGGAGRGNSSPSRETSLEVSLDGEDELHSAQSEEVFRQKIAGGDRTLHFVDRAGGTGGAGGVVSLRPGTRKTAKSKRTGKKDLQSSFATKSEIDGVSVFSSGTTGLLTSAWAELGSGHAVEAGSGMEEQGLGSEIRFSGNEGWGGVVGDIRPVADRFLGRGGLGYVASGGGRGAVLEDSRAFNLRPTNVNIGLAGVTTTRDVGAVAGGPATVDGVDGPVSGMWRMNEET